ncbi:MAG: outer membrane beta-barrel protein [Gemmatimonadota bacterium]|nr:outer membrane beta-barrel protein [Gemmatimonadota bacterium]
MLIALGVATATVAPAAKAQTGGDGFAFRAPKVAITLYGGFAAPSASSDLFTFSMRELTLGKSDFASGQIGGDVAVSVGDRLDLVVGASSNSSSTRSEFRDWVDNNNLPIEQTTYFRTVPLTASLRYYLTPRGQRVGSIAWIPRRFVPFASLGAGVVRYRFNQVGDFIDYQTLDVFADRYESSGTAGLLQGSVGAGWAISPHLQLTGEVRYLRARGELSSDFQGFKPLDLSGASSSVGITLRF